MLNHSRYVQKKNIFRSGSVHVVICWAVLQAVLLAVHGINIDGEAGKYVYEANRLLLGESLSGNNFIFYIVSIALIFASIKAGAGFYLAILVQLLLNLLATVSFYRLTRRLSDKRTATIFTLVLIFFYPYQQFNVFLQTESIYYSLVLLLTCYLLNLSSLSAQSLIHILLFLTVLTVTRPTGLLLSIPTFLYLHYRFIAPKYHFRIIPVYVAALIAGAVLFNRILGSGGELNFILPFVQEHIICGVPTRPVTGTTFSPEDNSITGILNYFVSHPGQVLRLGIVKSGYFFGVYRDYFSPLHNTLKVSAFMVLYVFVIIGTVKWFHQKKILLVFPFTLIFLTWMTVVFTCDDWHNRFVLCLIPSFLLLALPAGRSLTNKKLSTH